MTQSAGAPPTREWRRKPLESFETDSRMAPAGSRAAGEKVEPSGLERLVADREIVVAAWD
jgi:hypothetical protein